MDIVALQKHVIASPRKLREVVFLVKKMDPAVAVDRLPFTAKRASWELRKVIMTAIANAKVRGLNSEDLRFKEIQIGEGPRLKRFRAGSRGRAKPYKKRMSHIRVVLTTKPKHEVKPVQAKDAKKTAEVKPKKEAVKKDTK